MTTMYFIEKFNNEEPKKLFTKWIYDKSKLQVLLSSGNTIVISINKNQNEEIILVIAILSIFIP